MANQASRLPDVAVAVAVAAVLCGSGGWLVACHAASARPSLHAAAPKQREIILHSGEKENQMMPAFALNEQDAKVRAARLERLRALGLNREALASFIRRYRGYSRERLVAEGFVTAMAPQKGTAMVAAEHRTHDGNQLLEQAKDILYGLLFGDGNSHARFERVERELLTLTLPRAKSRALGFMQAATELNAAGTWQDPESVSNDERADNVIVEVEYGEIKEEWIGDGIKVALNLINNLEVNEQILYARMTNIEQSTLIE